MSQEGHKDHQGQQPSEPLHVTLALTSVNHVYVTNKIRFLFYFICHVLLPFYVRSLLSCVLSYIYVIYLFIYLIIYLFIYFPW